MIGRGRKGLAGSVGAAGVSASARPGVASGTSGPGRWSDSGGTATPSGTAEPVVAGCHVPVSVTVGGAVGSASAPCVGAAGRRMMARGRTGRAGAAGTSGAAAVDGAPAGILSGAIDVDGPSTGMLFTSIDVDGA